MAIPLMFSDNRNIWDTHLVTRTPWATVLKSFLGYKKYPFGIDQSVDHQLWKMHVTRVFQLCCSFVTLELYRLFGTSECANCIAIPSYLYPFSQLLLLRKVAIWSQELLTDKPISQLSVLYYWYRLSSSTRRMVVVLHSFSFIYNN